LSVCVNKENVGTSFLKPWQSRLNDECLLMGFLWS